MLFCLAKLTWKMFWVGQYHYGKRATSFFFLFFFFAKFKLRSIVLQNILSSVSTLIRN